MTKDDRVETIGPVMWKALAWVDSFAREMEGRDAQPHEIEDIETLRREVAGSILALESLSTELQELREDRRNAVEGLERIKRHGTAQCGAAQTAAATLDNLRALSHQGKQETRRNFDALRLLGKQDTPRRCPSCDSPNAPLWVHNDAARGWTGSHRPCSDPWHMGKQETEG